MASPDPPPQPDFITFLFSEKPKFDCHFIVGEKTLVKPERFGAVKMMLMAHSTVFRTELEDSELKEKGEIAIKDMYPDTFRALLKFIYGYDITGDLEFDEADNMFYAAEKYMISNLKNKLAVRLIALLTPDNVCSLLNNPAISTHLQLKAHITQILRYETDKVLASPQFLELCTEGFVSILVQDGLTVPEIELWRAAMKWAKHRACRGDGDILREEITSLTKHIRICTVRQDEFTREIIPTKVLTRDEESAVSESISKQEKQESLTTFCNEIRPRTKLQRHPESTVGNNKLYLVYQKNLPASKEITFFPGSKVSVIELKPLHCIVKAQDGIMSKLTQFGMFASTCQVDCTVTVTRVNTTYHEPPVIITFSEQVRAGRNFTIPLTSEGTNIKLLPNSKYIVKVAFADNRVMCESCVLSMYFTQRPSLY